MTSKSYIQFLLAKVKPLIAVLTSTTLIGIGAVTAPKILISKSDTGSGGAGRGWVGREAGRQCGVWNEHRRSSCVVGDPGKHISYHILPVRDRP